MSFYIMSIDSLITSFEILEGHKPIEFKYESNQDDSLQNINIGDYIFGYYTGEGIGNLFKVEKVDSDSISLKKVINIDSLIDITPIIDPDEISKLQNAGNIIEISEETYEKIFKEFQAYISSMEISKQDDEDNSYDNIDCDKLPTTLQRMYFGAPGTGKSYEVTQVIKGAYSSIDEKDNPFVFKTTVYSDYSYYDFVGNIMPTKKDDEIKYEFQPGIFTQALNMAFKYSDNDIFLVIEEMSRGDIASIFGDIFQLLDRDANGVSEYSINNDSISYWLKKNKNDITKIYLPANLHILGTVNTSDQNVNVIDTAFKRRFDFIYVSVDPAHNEKGELLNEFTFELYAEGKTLEFEWNKLYMALNKFIVKELGLSEDKQLGQFFVKFENYGSDDDKFNAIKNKVLHYLWDDVQLASMNDNIRIFVKGVTTFSELYKEFSDKKLIFSEEFLNYYKQS